MKYDVLSLGPARMDVFVRLPDVDVDEVCSIDRQRCVIELGFGEKIAVRGIEFAVGGNTGNNAVGLTRLGYKVAMVGAMGNGWADRRAREVLAGEGVEMKYVTTDRDKDGFGVVINYQEERTILSYYPDALCCFPQEPELDADWVYLTSMGAGFEDFYRQAIEWVQNKGVKLAFNPGTRQLKLGREALGYVYRKADILFVNREEGALLLQGNSKSEILNPKQILAGLHNLGPRLVVMTDGPDGAYAYNGQKTWLMPPASATVVERTGAGDAFGAGFMAAILKDLGVVEALRWGACNAGSVLGFVGPQAGLLDQEGMAKWLGKTKGVEVREI